MISPRTPPLSEAETEACRQQIDGWRIVEVGGVRLIERAYPFGEFGQMIVLLRLLDRLTGRENHHPAFSYRKRVLIVRFTTYAINNLTINDFIMAAKLDARYRGLMRRGWFRALADGVGPVEPDE
ncbi:MAG: 4a-hydroxytetrahydrobiopterin dehydratase [Anaerolineae bacterium]|nr:4a-hydroxytetrahydrobiopterin dehydratase [Anaerolineae bacterium]